jgi:glycine hydroxymethyltransferase
MHTIAAKAVSFGESLQPEFHLYTENVLKNAKALSSTLMNDGFDIVSGGTDTHIVLVDLRPKGIKGNIAEESLGRAGITCNKNGVPFDPEKPMITSGIRLGSPACTTRGFNVSEFNMVGDLICEVLNSISSNNNEPVDEVEKSVKIKVEKLCSKFPIYEK